MQKELSLFFFLLNSKETLTKKTRKKHGMGNAAFLSCILYGTIVGVYVDRVCTYV